MIERNLRVLLIDDDIVDCEVVRRLLRGRCLLSEEPTGIQGVESTNSTRPQCVLLSTRLPDTDALDVLEQISAQERVVPVVLLAEAGDEETVETGIAGGALGYVSKSSLTTQTLWMAIEIALRGATVRRDLASARRELEHVTSGLTRELGGPLHGIARMSREIHERLADSLDPEATADLVLIQERSLGMAAAVDELAEYAIAGNQPADADWVDLNETIRHVLGQLDDVVRQANARVEVEPLPTVWGSGFSLLRLLKNLLSNSIKFHGRGTPFIRVSSQLKDGDWEISIQDNGIGIDPHRQSTIFRPFEGPTIGDPIHGRGLGLATCARIVESHGGRIRLFSNPGHGSIFRFTLKTPPAATASAAGLTSLP